MTIDEAIAQEKANAEKLRKIIETGYDGGISIEAIFCDDTSAIKEAYERFENCAKEHEQLAEWLEELKDYRDKNKMVVRVDVENMDSIKDKIDELSRYAENQYNKAIGDFAEKLKAECREHYVDCDPYFGVITDSILYEDDIDEIAEQLKSGGENEQSI